MYLNRLAGSLELYLDQLTTCNLISKKACVETAMSCYIICGIDPDTASKRSCGVAPTEGTAVYRREAVTLCF